MSKEIVQEIIGKAIEDEKFRETLFSNPIEALKGYDLTGMEKMSLGNLTKDNFEKFAGGLGDRTTKGWIQPGGG